MDKAELLRRKKARFRRRMKAMAAVLAAVALAATVLLLINLIRIHNSDTGSGDTLSTDNTSSEYSNDYYEIGNNPTDINKEYFKELNTAVEDNDEQAMAEAVVKCFITEYYTWTNKDGNYDVGGMQYIYTERQSDFETYTRDEVYKDMDQYITLYGRDNLMEVTSVEITGSEKSAEQFVATITEETNKDTASEEVDLTEEEIAEAAATATPQTYTYDAYTVTATWEYGTDTEMDLSQAQTSATFTVIVNNGRLEIAAIQ